MASIVDASHGAVAQLLEEAGMSHTAAGSALLEKAGFANVADMYALEEEEEEGVLEEKGACWSCCCCEA